MILAALAALVTCTSPHVADGDTITCSGTRVRIFGINAPEIAHPDLGIEEEPGGQQAKARMISLTVGRPVLCAVAGNQHDRYGRMVARCTVNGVDLGQVLLREGFACEWLRYDHGFYSGRGRVCDARGK